MSFVPSPSAWKAPPSQRRSPAPRLASKSWDRHPRERYVQGVKGTRPGGSDALAALRRRYLAEGDEGAMTELVRRTRRRLVALARGIVGPQDAEDAVQGAYFSLVRQATLPDDLPVRAYLTTAVVRIAYRARALQQKEERLAERLSRRDPPPGPVDEATTAAKKIQNPPTSPFCLFPGHHLLNSRGQVVQNSGLARANGITTRGSGTMRVGRIERSEEVLIDVISCVNQPELNDTSLACRTVDMSEHGMKVRTEMAIPVDTIVSLRLDFSAQLYRLEGEARWHREDMHCVGFRIMDESPDISDWNRMFRPDS